VTAPLVLLGYAVLVASLSGRWLSRAGWTRRSPRLGIAAWQAVTASVVLAVLLAGLSLAVPTLPITTDLARLVHSCASLLREHYSTAGGAAAAAGGAVLALAVSGRGVYCILASLSAARRAARLQRHRLQIIAERDPASGALVVEDPTPAVYCLPGGGREVVFTTAALHTLTPDRSALSSPTSAPTSTAGTGWWSPPPGAWSPPSRSCRSLLWRAFTWPSWSRCTPTTPPCRQPNGGSSLPPWSHSQKERHPPAPLLRADSPHWPASAV